MHLFFGPDTATTREQGRWPRTISQKHVNKQQQPEAGSVPGKSPAPNLSAFPDKTGSDERLNAKNTPVDGRVRRSVEASTLNALGSGTSALT